MIDMIRQAVATIDRIVPGPAAVVHFLLWIVLAWAIYRSARPMANAIVNVSGFGRRFRLRPARIAVIQGLVSDAIRAGVLLYVMLLTLTATGLVARDDLVWIIGLLSAGFGLAARPVLTDYLHGMTFIFGDTFAVGEKVHLPGVPGEVEGTVEHVGLRALSVRAQTGELFMVPNGEVRVVRNFGRGLFSMGTVHLRVRSDSVDGAVALLNGVKNEAVAHLPDLLEPWRVISQDETVSAQTQLTVVFKTEFGKAAELRPRLLGFLQRRLAESNIQVVE